MTLSPEDLLRIVALALDLARQGETDELREFIHHGLPVDSADGDGNSMLMLAAYHGETATVMMLLELGADPDLRNNRDQSPIAGALFKGEHDTVRVLRDAGADVDAGSPSARATAEMFNLQHLLD